MESAVKGSKLSLIDVKYISAALPGWGKKIAVQSRMLTKILRKRVFFPIAFPPYLTIANLSKVYYDKCVILFQNNSVYIITQDPTRSKIPPERSDFMVIVYTSNTGHTKEYAQMLAKAEKLHLYELDEATAKLSKDTQVFYFGPLMAGRITGLNTAVKQFCVVAACGVGMSPPGQGILDTISRANVIPNAPIFYLQGGWNPKQVSWVKRQAVNMVTKSFREQLERKGKQRTAEEQANLDMLLRGGSFVAFQNLTTIRNWLKKQPKQ